MMMRNIPFPFLMEDTLESIAEQARRLRAHQNSGVRAIRISRVEIARNWSAIEDHKWFLSERLGRDVGTAVAAQDYLSNIAVVAQPKSDLRARLVAAFERIIESEGLQAFTNVQRIMRGVPNSPALLPSSAQAWQHGADQREIKSVRVAADLIRAHARQIEEHKWFLSERLGRDVGTGAAALDLFENIRPALKSVSLFARLARAIDRMLEASGPNSIANLERAMRVRY